MLRLVVNWLPMPIRHSMGMFSFFGEVLGHVSFLGVPYFRTHFWSMPWGAGSGARDVQRPAPFTQIWDYFIGRDIELNMVQPYSQMHCPPLALAFVAYGRVLDVRSCTVKRLQQQMKCLLQRLVQRNFKEGRTCCFGATVLLAELNIPIYCPSQHTRFRQSGFVCICLGECL